MRLSLSLLFGLGSVGVICLTVWQVWLSLSNEALTLFEAVFYAITIIFWAAMAGHYLLEAKRAR